VVIIESTEQEAADLERAIARNCTCDPETGRRCALCKLATEDRAFLTHLLFVRRIGRKFWQAEFKR
jgi:hypothetical protein